MQVTEGSGSMMVTAVGEHSEWGKTMALVRTEAADTPLQGSLAWLAAAIGKLGLTVGILCFIVLMIRYASIFSGLTLSFTWLAAAIGKLGLTIGVLCFALWCS